MAVTITSTPHPTTLPNETWRCEPTPVDFLQRINSKQEQASPHRAACPKKCQPELCPSSHLLQRCPAGRAKDSCGCCWECGNAEGQFCDVDPSAGLYGRCAEGLKCRVPPKQKSHFLSGEERKEEVEEAPRPVCVCARQDVLCATDGNTYENKCQLRSAQHNMAPGQDKPTLAHYGPCRSRPVITMGPQDSHVLEGSDAVFVCEVSSFPLATVHWTKDGENILLPPTDPNLAAQARRGPQRFELSGWLQIQGTRAADEGVYACWARNAFGETSASARLQVLRKGWASDTFGMMDDEEGEDDEDYDEGHSSGHMYV
ncbi:kazal-type serine peptidase inhibitor domain 2 [Engraulis encrasicolus]|uniref:kazal-type serine peptidase inhibitor domain 2 n=1 Tax=Engraulis encrasicolus TaxID=184585 RepID=UPI002FCEE340